MRRRRRSADEVVRYAPRPGAPAGGASPEGVDPAAGAAPLPPAIVQSLRDLHAAPAADAPYWDGLEARIMAAVRDSAALTTGAVTGAVTGAMRAVPAAAAEWWHTLARWTRPALVAASVSLVAAGAALLQARAAAEASRAHSAYRAVLGDPYDSSALPLPDPQLARVLDAYDAEPGDTAAAAEARAARVAAELLSDGLVRRAPNVPATIDRRAPGVANGSAHGGTPAERRARREATFRAVLPAP